MKLLFKLIYFCIDIIIPKANFFIFTSKGGLCSEQNLIELYKFYKSKGETVYLLKKPNSIKELWISLRAKTVFLTHGPGDIPYALHSFRKNVVYLGHGITIKKMLFADNGLTLKRKIISGLETRFFSHVIASSEMDQDSLSHVFKLSKSKIKITGLPRIDSLKKAPKELSELFKRKGKFILYAPTYRSYAPTNYFNFNDSDLEVLNNYLTRNDFYIVIRSHPNDKGLSRSYFEFSNILDGNTILSIQDYLTDFEALITDFSSIYIDFLTTKKKVAFIPYDLNEYIEKTGLFYNYHEITPGPHIKSQKELISFLEEPFNKFLDERKKVTNMFFKYNDNKSSQRIYDIFK